MNEIDVYTPITIEGTEQGTGTPRVILARYPCSDDVMYSDGRIKHYGI